jgi:hypothetical protein
LAAWVVTALRPSSGLPDPRGRRAEFVGGPLAGPLSINKAANLGADATTLIGRKVRAVAVAHQVTGNQVGSSASEPGEVVLPNTRAKVQ